MVPWLIRVGCQFTAMLCHLQIMFESADSSSSMISLAFGSDCSQILCKTFTVRHCIEVRLQLTALLHNSSRLALAFVLSLNENVAGKDVTLLWSK